MKRNIVTTIEFSKGYLSINVLENLSNNQIEIFSDKDDIKNAKEFLDKSINKIQELIGGSIKEVLVVIEESEKINSSIKLVRNSISIVADVVSKKDVENLINLTKEKNKKENEEIIVAQPLQFEVVDVVRKKYSRAPIHKKGDILAASFALTYISKEALEYIKNILFSQKLNISQIFLKSQAISQTHLSEHALVSGASLVNVGQNNTTITINKNCGTVASLVLYDAGYKSLLKDVMQSFNCTEKEAKNITSIYGSLMDKENRVVYVQQNGINETRYTYLDLQNIIKSFIKRILSLANKFLTQKGVHTLPMVISGRITSLENFDQYAKKLKTNHVSIYNPISYVEFVERNHNSIGFINWSKKMDEIFGKQFNTIVETNPNTFNTLFKSKKTTIWTKIINKLGGKYDWYN